MDAGVAVRANRVILLLIVCELVPIVDHNESSLVFRAGENPRAERMRHAYLHLNRHFRQFGV